MKRILLLLAIIAPMLVFGRSISNIDRDGSWYHVYDETGKKYKTFNQNTVGELKGWCGDFFVTQYGSWIYTYDIEGKKIKGTTTDAIGEVISVSGGTITTKSGSWIYTFDKNFKKISSRAAN